MKNRDVYVLVDSGWEGWTPYGPYTEEEANRHYPSPQDVKVRVVGGTPFEAFYSEEYRPGGSR